MQREILEPENEEAWLALRDLDVTSTGAAALFGLSPYETEFQLYIAKKDGLRLPFNDNDRVQSGRRLQDYAADTIAEKHGWKVFRKDNYIRIPELRIGSSFDYEVVCPVRGVGNLEIKGVDHFRYKETWDQDEAPPHIEVQVQHQMEVADRYDWTCIAAFTSIFDWHEIYRERDREMGAAIRARVARFWADVDVGREPRPDFAQDNDILKKLHVGGLTVNAIDDDEANALFSRYVRTKAERDAAENDFKAAEGAFFNRFREVSEVFGRDFKAKITQVKASPGRTITEDEVGKLVGARSGYPKLTITDLHKQKGRAA